MSEKTRLDLMMVRRALVKSRQKAQDVITNGLVMVDGRVCKKPAAKVDDDSGIELLALDHPWVSRGGIKLDKGLKTFNISVEGKICLDVGASTGGFSEVLLTYGAAQVFAVDVGQGQIDPTLRDNPRLNVLEKTDARKLDTSLVPLPIDVIVCDVSYISLEKALPKALALAGPACHLVCLVKPQFELSPREIGKGGIVKQEGAQSEACQKVWDWIVGLPGWTPEKMIPSPIAGRGGNLEFLMWARFSRASQQAV